MKLAVVDTETTGNQEHDQVMDLAILVLEDEYPKGPEFGKIAETFRWSSLIRPEVPCSFEARAIHHITDAMVADSWTMLELLDQRGLPEFDGGVFVAQNAAFDLAMLKQSGVTIDNPVICTWRCAQHLWPDAPKHSNQVLRYWLGLDDKYGSLHMETLPPHRALPDTLVTSRLLMEMLRLKSYPDLIELTRTPILHTKVRFGKYEGMTWAEVGRSDPGYLRWIVGQGPKRTVGGVEKGFDADMLHTANYHLRNRT